MDVKRTWPMVAKYMTPEKREKFWSLVDRRGPDECWPWKGLINAYGYGAFNYAGVTGVGPITAHRMAYGLACDGIPGRKHILHRCDNRPCCNPAHLFVGTHRENMKDMVAKGRAGWQQEGDPCECGNPKSKVAVRCRACAAIAHKSRLRFGSQRRLRVVRDARLERLWQIAIKCPPTRAELVAALQGDERRAEVMIRSYGLFGQRHLSLTDMGKLVGLTRERVRQMRNDALVALGLADRGAAACSAVLTQKSA